MKSFGEPVTYNKITKSGFSRTSSWMHHTPTQHFLHPLPHSLWVARRASLRASLTVEATLVLPVFLLAVFELIGMFQVYRKYDRDMTALYENAKSAAVWEYASEEILDLSTDVVDLVIMKPIPMKLSLTGRSPIICERARVKTWNGYSGSETQEKYVYVTENREAYHLTPHCSYLEIEVIEIRRSEAELGELADGKKVYPCAFCVNPGASSGKYYTTATEERYHCDIGCSSLKRVIYMVSPDSVSDLHPCVRCGQKEKGERE